MTSQIASLDGPQQWRFQLQSMLPGISLATERQQRYRARRDGAGLTRPQIQLRSLTVLWHNVVDDVGCSCVPLNLRLRCWKWYILEKWAFTGGSRISLDLLAGRCPRGNKCSVGVQAAIRMTSRNATKEDELSGAELDSCVLGSGGKNTSLLWTPWSRSGSWSLPVSRL